MAKPEENSRRIQDYLNREMPEAEQLSFEKSCAEDKSLADALALHQSVAQTLKDKEALAFRHQLESRIAASRPSGDTSGGKPTSSQRNVLLLLFILAVLTAAGLVFFGDKEQPPLPETIAEPEVAAPALPNDAGEKVPDPSTQIVGEERIPPNAQDASNVKKRIAAGSASGEKQAQAFGNPAYQQLALSEYRATTFVFRGINANKEPTDTAQQALLLFAQANAAKDANEQENYLEQALEILNDNQVAKDQRLLLTRAQAYFQMGQYAQAASDFQDLQNSFIYGGNADWGLALCYTAQMPAKADAFQDAMSVMLKDESHSFHAKALQLSKQVEAIEK